MKKIISLILILTMALSLCACGEAEKEERYSGIADLLDAGKYEKAIEVIKEMWQKAEENKNNNGDGDGDQDPGVPTDEEKALLKSYKEIAERLYGSAVYGYEYYCEDENGNYLSGHKALRYAYEQLLNMDCTVIDKWWGTDYLSMEDGLEYDTVMSNFTVFQDVVLSCTSWYEDALGNINANEADYIYDAYGSITDIASDAWGGFSDPLSDGVLPSMFKISYYYLEGVPELTYDTNGNLVTVRYLDEDDGSVNCIIDYTYNADGTVAAEGYRARGGDQVTISYTYEDGRLARVTRESGYTEFDIGPFSYTCFDSIDYTYDSEGNLSQIYITTSEDHSYSYNDYMVRYFYSEAGELSAVCTARLYYTEEFYLKEYNEVFYYTCTWEFGDLTQVAEHYYGEYDAEGNQTYDPGWFNYYYDYTYGDYYFYGISQ